MKLVVMMALLCMPGVALAKCAAWSLEAYPSADEKLPTNGRIVLEGFGSAQALVRDAAAKNPALVSGDTRVELKAEVLPGEYGLTQAILTPIRALEPGKTWKLSVAAAKGSDAEALARLSWTTAAQPDTRPPSWDRAPTADKGTWTDYGCGPGSQVPVKVAAADESGVLFLAEVHGPKKATRFLVRASPDKTLLIGHGMCSGAFDLKPKEKYALTLTAVDYAGNATPAPGAALSIEGPAPE